MNSLPSDLEKDTEPEAPEAPAYEEPAAPVVEELAAEPVAETVDEVAETVEEKIDEAVAEVEEKVDELKYDEFAPRLDFEDEKPAEERKSRFGNLDFGDRFDFGNK